MYNMRGYGLSFKNNYRQEALSYIEELHGHLNEAESLAKEYAGLVKLQEGVNGAGFFRDIGRNRR